MLGDLAQLFLGAAAEREHAPDRPLHDDQTDGDGKHRGQGQPWRDLHHLPPGEGHRGGDVHDLESAETDQRPHPRHVVGGAADDVAAGGRGEERRLQAHELGEDVASDQVLLVAARIEDEDPGGGADDDDRHTHGGDGPDVDVHRRAGPERVHRMTDLTGDAHRQIVGENQEEPSGKVAPAEPPRVDPQQADDRMIDPALRRSGVSRSHHIPRAMKPVAAVRCSRRFQEPASATAPGPASAAATATASASPSGSASARSAGARCGHGARPRLPVTGLGVGHGPSHP
jgi:hypothetical protein